MTDRSGKPPKEELKVSIYNSVYHVAGDESRGVLCSYDVRWDGIIYNPIIFKDRAAAYKWIEDGCIAHIQEGLSDLHIGFSTVLFKPREIPFWQR